MFSFTTNVQWMTNLLILCGSPKVDLQLRYFWHHLKYLMYRSYRTELTFRETELTFSPPKNIKIKSWKIRWTEVTFAGQKWLLVDRSDFVFLRLDRTVFFVLFIGQKCRFPYIFGKQTGRVGIFFLNDASNISSSDFFSSVLPHLKKIKKRQKHFFFTLGT